MRIGKQPSLLVQFSQFPENPPTAMHGNIVDKLMGSSI
jgi:hypothetical protein